VNLFSAPVLLGAALISSPALWSGFVGQAPVQMGLSRYLLAVAFSWGALSLVATLVGPARSAAVEVAGDGVAADGTASDGAASDGAASDGESE
jgi:hypothetical protein